MDANPGEFIWQKRTLADSRVGSQLSWATSTQALSVAHGIHGVAQRINLQVFCMLLTSRRLAIDGRPGQAAE